MPPDIKFLQSSPPLVVTSGGALNYYFGIVEKMIIHQAFVEIPLNIPDGWMIVGEIKLAGTFIGATTSNFTLSYRAGNLAPQSAGALGFSASNLGVFMPRGSLTVQVYPDKFTQPPPYHKPLIIGYEAMT